MSPARAELNAAQKATFEVIQYELTLNAVEHAVTDGVPDLAVALRTGAQRPSAMYLDGLWSYRMYKPSTGSSRRVEPPPLAATFFSTDGSWPDLKDKKGVDFLVQFNRYLGSLLGGDRNPSSPWARSRP